MRRRPAPALRTRGGEDAAASAAGTAALHLLPRREHRHRELQPAQGSLIPGVPPDLVAGAVAADDVDDLAPHRADVVVADPCPQADVAASVRWDTDVLL